MFAMRLLNLFAPNPENCVVTATRLLGLLGVPVTNTTLQKDLLEHPDYPSLLSISDVLTRYGVENISIKSNMEKIEKLPLPLVAQLNGAQGRQTVFTVIKKTTEKNIECLAPEKNKWISLSKDEFTNRWTGIVMLTEATEGAGEKEFLKKRKEEKRQNTGSILILLALPFIASIAAFFAFSNAGVSAILPVVFLFITLIGCFTGALLLMHEIGQHNPLLQQLCGAGKKTNCNAILQSKASKIAGIPWSHIGFSYFMGGLLSLLFLGVTNPQTLFLIAWINILALPYTIFSIYYQWRVAKQWCPLCLTVQALLFLQFITAFAGGWHGALALAGLNPSVIIAVAVAFLLPLLSSRPGEFHPESLIDPYVILSHHTALII